MNRFKKFKKQQAALSSPTNPVRIYTDGSHRPPDNASFAYLLYSDTAKDVLKMGRRAVRGATINGMELAAINEALNYPGLKHVVIHTDSAYCIGCLSLWRHNWARNNWTVPNGTPVKNKDLIESIGKKLDALGSFAFAKVKAHTGEPFNTVVDYLAQGMSKRMRDDETIIDLSETW